MLSSLYTERASKVLIHHAWKKRKKIGSKGGKKTQVEDKSMATGPETILPTTQQTQYATIPRKTCQTSKKDLPDSNISTSIHPNFDKELLDLNDTLTEERKSLITLVENIRKKYPSFIPYYHLVKYLYIINTNRARINEDPTIVTMINTFHPFYIMALYFFKKTMYSHLFQALCERALLSKIEEAKWNEMPLATKHCFHLCHIAQDKGKLTSKTRSGIFSKEKKSLLN